jgi:hypothetical protein
MRPRFILVDRVPLLAVHAIMLWPFIVIRRDRDDPCLRGHELYHFDEASSWGVLPWYVTYLVIVACRIGRPASSHPMERLARLLERECRARRARDAAFIPGEAGN